MPNACGGAPALGGGAAARATLRRDCVRSSSAFPAGKLAQTVVASGCATMTGAALGPARSALQACASSSIVTTQTHAARAVQYCALKAFMCAARCSRSEKAHARARSPDMWCGDHTGAPVDKSRRLIRRHGIQQGCGALRQVTRAVLGIVADDVGQISAHRAAGNALGQASERGPRDWGGWRARVAKAIKLGVRSLGSSPPPQPPPVRPAHLGRITLALRRSSMPRTYL